MKTIADLVEEFDHVRDAFTTIAKHPDSDLVDHSIAMAYRDRCTFALRLAYEIAGNPHQLALWE